jgi:hypothetical protein
MYLTPVHMWAESEYTQMLSTRMQYLQIKQVKMKRPKNLCRERYEEALCSAEALSGILLPQEDITSGFLCIQGRIEE